MGEGGVFVVREVTDQALCAAAVGVPCVGSIPAALVFGASPAAVAGAFVGGYALAFVQGRRRGRSALDEIPALTSHPKREPSTRTALRAALFWPAPIAALVAGMLAAGALYDAAWAGALLGGALAVNAVAHARVAWHAHLWERNRNLVLYRERTFLVARDVYWGEAVT
jgi:hypothetical protein